MKRYRRIGSAALPGKAGARRRLPALLLAVPICTFASTGAATRLAVPPEPEHGRSVLFAGVAGTASRSLFSAPDTGVPLVDDNDRDHRDAPRHWYPGNRSHPGEHRWSDPEQGNRIEDRRRRFEALPPNQQQRLIQTRQRFLNLPPETRDRLRQRWQEMTPEQRRRWRESMPQRDSQQRN